tara:strand:- start:1164 stop:2231 length:1068 start_codon:yes stop_codon:yes gene_type:complete
MARKITKLSLPLAGDEKFDEIIDVRAPVEFAEDHMSGALNLPVLNDEEREKVGTIYKQESSFEARRIGAALVARNIARHLETHFLDKPKDYRPLIYCWRGGQRSGAMATILNDVGWNVTLINQGYRAYRKVVIDTFEKIAGELKLVVLNGYTGAGKTLVLKAIRAKGGQVLDLEGLAEHKGSVFGGDLEVPQPAQKRFESLIYDGLSQFDLSQTVFAEAESAKIGRLNLPNPLWQKMKQAGVIEIDSPLSARADFLTDDYSEWVSDSGRISMTLDRLGDFQSKAKIADWKEMVRLGQYREFVGDLLAEHYDKKYNVSGDGNYAVPSQSVRLDHHDPESVSACADEVIRVGEEMVT